MASLSMPATRVDRIIPSDGEARRARYREHRAIMRTSETYSRCRSTVSAICLLVGHVRPVAKAVPWQIQPVQMPGDAAAPPVARAKDVADQMAKAFSFQHPLDAMASALPGDVRLAMKWQCELRSAGGHPADDRADFLQALEQCGSELEGWSTQLREISAPPWLLDSTPPIAHCALVECLNDVMGLPDDRLGEDLVCGMPCVGDIPDSGDFRADRAPAACNIDDLPHREWHDKIVSQLTDAGLDPSRLDEHVSLMGRTTKEIKDGWVVRIGSLEEANAFFGSPDAFRASVRFGISQHGKLRPCENCRASLHNLATSLHEALVTETADFPARAAALYSELVGDAVLFSLSLGTEDVSSAYRLAPCSQPWYTVFAQWDPQAEAVVFFRLQGFNFGLKSAVLQFNRLSFFIARAAARLLRICCTSYFDDFCVVEPSFDSGGQLALRKLASILRIPFAGERLGDGKSHAPSPANVFLGVNHDFARFRRFRESEASIDPDRLADVHRVLSSVIEARSFSGDAGPSKLAGRLHFTLTWGARRFGRAALQPLHAASSSSFDAVSPTLYTALCFVRDLLTDPATGKARQLPRRFRHSRRSEPPVLVWSDARWEASDEHPAGIGFVVFFPASDDDASAAAAARSPPWLGGAETPRGRWKFAAYEPPPGDYSHWRERSQYIGQLELLAAVTVYYSLADDLRDKRVVHFIDNSGAFACLIKDYSSDRDSAALVHTFWALAVGLNVDVWFVFVYSEANIADWPSRGLTSFAADLGAERVTGDSLRLPPTAAWGSVGAALEHASATAPPRVSSRKRSKRGVSDSPSAT